jgi:signal peptidase II
MRLFGLFVTAVVIFFDQLTKWLVLEHGFRGQLGLGDPMRLLDWLHQAPQQLPPAVILVSPFFSLTMVWNTGISFGLMAGGGWGLLTIASLVIAFFFLIWMFRTRFLADVIALALIIGGALGNVADRLRFGAVADFLDFHWQDWHFPAFNLADSAISIGVAVLIIHGLFFARKSI